MRTSTLLFLSGISLSAQPSAKPARQALLILDGGYGKVAPLKSTHADGDVLEPSLKTAGFQVTRLEDQPLPELISRIENSFMPRVNPGDVVLVFYSGYAVQDVDNFLVPVDFDPQSTAPLTARALSLKRIQDDLDDRKASLAIFLIDACRDQAQLSTIGMGPGLALPDLSGSTEAAMLFSAPLNRTIPDPPGDSAGKLASLFSEAIQKPGSGLLPTLTEVQGRLAGETGTRPYLIPSARTFYFKDPLPSKPAAPPPALTVDLLTKTPQVHRLDRQEYKFIPKGTFQMGCVPSDRKQEKCEDAEKPRHEVRLTKDFWIGTTDVTWEAYDRFVSTDKRRKKPKWPFWSSERNWSTYHPVVSVSWADAVAYCQWLGGSLPTEAQWEYAARAGNVGEVYPFNSENSREKANFSGTAGNDRFQHTSPVKSFDPNPWGLYDMSGNVWQFTADWFSPTYYAASSAEDPKGPDFGKMRVARGGSWYSDPSKHLRMSFRFEVNPEGSDRVGFRCVLPDTPEMRKSFAEH
jgi:formylglycine-generating enzyme required for sulfatase activity